MNFDLNKLVQAEAHRVRCSFAYEIMGRFGSRLPKDMLDQLTETAEAEMRMYDVKMSRINNKL